MQSTKARRIGQDKLSPPLTNSMIALEMKARALLSVILESACIYASDDLRVFSQLELS